MRAWFFPRVFAISLALLLGVPATAGATTPALVDWELISRAKTVEQTCNEFLRDREQFARRLAHEKETPGRRHPDLVRQAGTIKATIADQSARLFRIWELTRAPELATRMASLTRNAKALDADLAEISTLDFQTQQGHDELFMAEAQKCADQCSVFSRTMSEFTSAFIPDQLKDQIRDDINRLEACLTYKSERGLILGYTDKLNKRRALRLKHFAEPGSASGMLSAFWLDQFRELDTLLTGLEKPAENTGGSGSGTDSNTGNDNDAPPSPPTQDTVPGVVPPTQGNDEAGSTNGSGPDDQRSGKIEFAARHPANWVAQPIDNGMRFTRNPARTKGSCGSTTSIRAEMVARLSGGGGDDKAVQQRIADTLAALNQDWQRRNNIGCASPDLAVGLYKAGGLEGVSSLTVGPYRGGIADYPNWVRRGSWSGAGYTDSTMRACGMGAAHARDAGIEFSYSVTGTGCWDNKDHGYLIPQMLAAQKEARAIIASLRLDGTGIRQDPYTGPKYDGSDRPVVRLVPATLAKLKVGDVATVTAVVDNASADDPPYVYDWDGQFHGNAKELRTSSTVRLMPDKPGKFKVGVFVTGQRFGIGYASLDYEVADIKLTIRPNTGGQVKLGSQAHFEASLTVDGKPAKGDYIFRWEPYEDIRFAPAEGRSPTTTATFIELNDRQPLWVEALVPSGEKTLATVAKSDQIVFQVVPPALKLELAPNPPQVGREARITASLPASLDSDTVVVRWYHQGDFISPGTLRDDRVFLFTPKSSRKMSVTVQAFLRAGNVDLGQQQITFTPLQTAFKVDIDGPHARGPKLKIWRCDSPLCGTSKCCLVDMPEGQFAVFQDIDLRAVVIPKADNLRYSWTVNPTGLCGLTGIGSEQRLNCSQVGNYQVTLQVRDADGAILGQSVVNVPITISADMIKDAERARQADDKVKQAIQIVRLGQLDEAIELVTQAMNLNYKHPDASHLRDRWSAERQQVMQFIGTARSHAEASDFLAAGQALEQARRLHPRFGPVLEAGRWLEEKRQAHEARQSRLDQMLENGRAYLRAGRYAEAQAIVKDLYSQDTPRYRTLSRELVDAAKQAARAAELAWDFDTSGRLYGLARETDGNDAEAMQGATMAAQYKKTLALVLAWRNEIRAGLDRGDFDLAETRLDSLLRIEAGLPGGVGRETRDLDARYKAEFSAYAKVVEDLKTRAEKAMSTGYCDEANRLVDKVAQHRPVKQDRYWIDMMRRTLAEAAQRGSCGKNPGVGEAPGITGKPVTAKVGETSLSMESDLVEPGKPFTVRFTVAPGISRYSYIPLVPASTPHGEAKPINQQRLSSQEIIWRTDNTLTYTAPTTPGRYELRFIEGGLQKEILSLPFEVRKGAGTVTRPPATTGKGHWHLVDRRLDKKPGSDCYPVEVAGPEGNLTVTIRSVCGENGAVTVRAGWSPPPDTLIPGETLRIDTSLAGQVSGTNRGLDVPMSAEFERAGLSCGTRHSRVTLIEDYSAGVGKAGGVRQGSAPVPAFGTLGSGESGRMQLRLCSRNWGQYYVYEWVK